MKRRKKEGGFVTAEFVGGVAFLMLPVSLLVLVMPMWAERQSAARVAAREGAREYVVTNDIGQGEEAALRIAANHKIKPEDMRVELIGDPAVPGSSVRAVVHVKVPMIEVPIIDRRGGGFELEADHTEIVDLYRSRPQ